jgi:DNA-binding response OmpR family regulator
MPSRPARLLCVGKDPDLLQTRCAVLSRFGYDAISATVADAEMLLRTEEFDLVIVSAFLSQAEKNRVISAASETPTLALDGLTFAPDLLAEVERRLLPESKV